MLVPISEKIKPWLLVSATWGHHSWTFGTVDVAWNPGEQKLPSWIFPNDHLTTMRSHAWQKKGPSIQSTKAWRPAAFQSSPWRCKKKQEALILLAVLENCRKSTTGPPTNTWRLAFQSCTIANTNWRSSAFCVDVVALYQKQGPVFSLNSKSILGYKF